MKLADFDYDLPPELIAQQPSPQRHGARMLVLPRSGGPCELRTFAEFAHYLVPGDCLVLNDTKVIPARLYGRREHSGGHVEMLLIERSAEGHWKTLMRPGRRMQPGNRVYLDDAGAEGVRVLNRLEDGTFTVEFFGDDDDCLIDRYGSIPLPPYIRRDAQPEDRQRYQTVYARVPGAVAAPTAGLHFTPEVLAGLRERDVKTAFVTLHVGPGTFKPVQAENIEEHLMHEEAFVLTPESAETINAARRAGRRVVAVGTTSVRVLESCADPATRLVTPREGRTRLFMHPPMRPLVTDALLTNFHLPKSTLLMLVSTFASTEAVMNAYQLAVAERFRFYSYGDCMLLI